MAGRPGWHDAYWKNLDKDTQKKLRTMCPRCGSANTTYNQVYKTWQCNRCEHSFRVDLGDKRPWWKRLWGRK